MGRALAIATALTLALLAIAAWLTTPAHAHSWYSDKHDPVTTYGCCGGSDCAQLVIEPGVMTAEPDGYRIRLTLDQAKRINRYRIDPLDVLVPWDRIQPSEDGNYHLCLPTSNGRARDDFYCFFAPPNT